MWANDIGPAQHHYLTTGRRLRRLAFLAAMVVPPLAGTALWGEAAQVDVISTPVLVALMVATLLAELATTRPDRAARRRVASLRPRELGSYVPRSLRFGPAVAGCAAAIAWAGALLLPDQPAYVPDRWTNPTTREIATGIALGLGVPIAITLVGRWIVRRPQPLADPALTAADDAMRRASVHRIAAMGCCIALLGLADALQRYSGAFNGPIDPVVALALTVCLALTAWAWFRRDHATAPAAGPVDAWTPT